MQCTRCSHVFTAEAPSRPVHVTQVFGAVNPPPSGPPLGTGGDAEPPPEHTQIYGRKNPIPQAAPAAPAAPMGTQMFGAVHGAPPAPSAPMGMQMFGAVQAAAPAPAAAMGTQMFGAVQAAPPAPPAPMGTQIFGAVRSAPAEGVGEEQKPTSRTQIFGKVQPPPPNATLPLFPGASPSDAPIRGEQLPRRRWRRSRAVLVPGAIALIGLGWAGVREWRARTTVLPAEAVLAQSEAVNTLRRDDAESIAAARAKLETLLQRWPRYLEARASHLTALLFQLDEARMEVLRFTREAAEIDAEINLLRERQSPQDWEDRIAALVDRQGDIKAQNDRFADRAVRRDTEVNHALQELQGAVGPELAPGDDIQLARAQALHFAVTGSEEALAVSERYRLLGGQEGWGEVASAAYALNAPVAPETRRQAREALEALRTKDPSWVRLYVMIGRLALAEGALDVAITALESAVTLNPKHEVARSLLAQANKRAKDAAAVSVSP